MSQMEQDTLLPHKQGEEVDHHDQHHHHAHHHHTDSSFFALNISNHLHHLHQARDAIRKLSILEILFITVAVVFVVGGNCGQLLVLNLWVNAMGEIPPPITILTVSATTIMLGYVLCLVARYVFVLRRQPGSSVTKHFGFLQSWKGLALSVVIGLCNSSNGILLVYATGGTPEILQALLLCTQIFWTMLFAKLFLRDPRSFLSPLVILSFLMCAGGIVLGASPQFSSGPGMSANTRNWTFIFAASMIPGALYNVFASMYMRSFTSLKKPQTGNEEFVDDDSASCSSGSVEDGDQDGDLVNAQSSTAKRREATAQSDDTTVKLTMLSTTGLSQVIWMFTLMPLDAVPWFGGSETVQDTATNLSNGWQCVFSPHSQPGCEKAYRYYILFNVSYFLNYLGSAYLNHYSAALNSMVSQIASPVAAIVLLIAPSLNVDAQPVQVGASIGAVILIMLGSAVYTLWEQGTRHHLK